MLAGSAALGATWVAPSIVRMDRASAGTGSCISTTVNWSSASGSVAAGYVATGTSGTLTITANVTANVTTGTTPDFRINGSRIIIGMSNHANGDSWDVALTFSDSTGATICTASTLVIDVDRNGTGLGCPQPSRFVDNINAITGPGLVTTTFGNLMESPTGNFVSSLTCKTGDTENLGLSWTAGGGSVTGAGFTWASSAPAGTSPGPDYQLIKVDPVTLCVRPLAVPAPTPGERLGSEPVSMIRGADPQRAEFGILGDSLNDD